MRGVLIFGISALVISFVMGKSPTKIDWQWHDNNLSPIALLRRSYTSPFTQRLCSHAVRIHRIPSHSLGNLFLRLGLFLIFEIRIFQDGEVEVSFKAAAPPISSRVYIYLGKEIIKSVPLTGLHGFHQIIYIFIVGINSFE